MGGSDGTRARACIQLLHQNATVSRKQNDTPDEQNPTAAILGRLQVIAGNGLLARFLPSPPPIRVIAIEEADDEAPELARTGELLLQASDVS